MGSKKSLLALALIIASAASAWAAPDVRTGRLLASNCTQCHGANGQPRDGIESLTGKSYSSLKKEMLEMAKKSPTSEAEEEIMIIHAKAYTPAEIDAIAYFLSLP